MAEARGQHGVGLAIKEEEPILQDVECSFIKDKSLSHSVSR